MIKKRSSEILADENQEKVKLRKVSSESENFSKIGGNLKQGGKMLHSLRGGMDALVCGCVCVCVCVRERESVREKERQGGRERERERESGGRTERIERSASLQNAFWVFLMTLNHSGVCFQLGSQNRFLSSSYSRSPLPCIDSVSLSVTLQKSPSKWLRL